MPLIATRGAASAQGFGEFAQSAAPNYIEEVFQTWLYTGNGSTQTITNGIDLAGKGGLVWTKSRNNAQNHIVNDTVRGAGKQLIPNSTLFQQSESTALTSFNSNGFSLGSKSDVNDASNTYVSWTFREQAKFFDVVTYTGNAVSGRTVAHNLGSVPGCIIIKRTDSASDWAVMARRSGFTSSYATGLKLNATNARTNDYDYTIGSDISSTVFPVFIDPDSGLNAYNVNGATYVAYLFAHNAGGFGLTGTDNVISCGSFNYSTFPQTVTLDYEPQWLMVKRSDGVGDWIMFDTMRGFTANPSGGAGRRLLANTSDAETANDGLYYGGATGFNLNLPAFGNYIYIAIRRGPMKVPTTGTSVYSGIARTGDGVAKNLTGAGFAPDSVLFVRRTPGANPIWNDKLRGPAADLFTSSVSAEDTAGANITGWNNDGVNIGSGAGVNVSGTTYINWLMRRAPSFFDEVCYTGTGSATTFSHNLAAVPQLIIFKMRSGSRAWPVYDATNGNSGYSVLSSDSAWAGPDASVFNNTSPTSSVFTVNTSTLVNGSGSTYVAYLFATCPGVSRVGSYTGTGTTQVINCGFTAGSRFVLIKATSTTGNWLVWDSARGIVAGNDPYLALNLADAEVTTTDWVDTAATGFELSNAGGNLANSNGVTYIFLAIA